MGGLATAGLGTGLTGSMGLAGVGDATEGQNIMQNVALMSALSGGNQTVNLSPAEIIQIRLAVHEKMQRTADTQADLRDKEVQAKVDAEVAKRMTRSSKSEEDGASEPGSLKFGRRADPGAEKESQTQ